jgi:hypothetical protein
MNDIPFQSNPSGVSFMTIFISGRSPWRFLLPVVLMVHVFIGFPSAVAPAISAIPQADALFVQPAESFQYGISWASIPVGSATMEITTATPAADQSTLRLMTTAKSNKYLSRFFPVSDRVESTVDAQSLLPLRMVFQRREGNRRDDFHITFDRQEGRAHVIKNGETTIQEIPPDIHDAISCLYYLRRQPSLEKGSSFFLHIHHNKENYQIEARVEGVEAVAGPWGTVSAIRVLVITPSQGIFSNEGNIRVWLTNDRHHIPLMLNAKVTFGSVKFLLQKSRLS